MLLATTLPSAASGVGESVCVPSANSYAGMVAYADGLYEVGTRATIEGQQLPLCIFAGTFYGTGSFHWTALVNARPNWVYGGEVVNIVQVGYGRCQYVNNSLGLGTLCDNKYHWYWAWGSYCGSGSPYGTLPGSGPVPIRIGAALTDPPPTKDIYVIRHFVNGVLYYDGYVGGALLTGTDALGDQVSARVRGSQICWDSDDAGSNRQFQWFGETWNTGDSMGGWTGSNRNHLDYTSQRYTVNTGWKSPNWTFPGPCVAQTEPIYTCTLSGLDRMYVDTSER